MAVTVKVTETYDMKTTVGKMGLVGIHTPQLSLIRKLYPGLLKNHRFIRFVKCDVVGACASVLPADPLQIGVSSGTVAPEDMFNPILYTAVTNSSFDTIVARVRALTDVSSLASVSEGQIWNDVTSEDVNFQTYYAMLSENGKWRKSMPQSGFNIRGLVPLAHTVISTFGNVGPIGNTNALGEDGETPVSVPDLEIPEVNENGQVTSGSEIFYRGKSIKMPKFPIHTSIEANDAVPFPNVPKTHVLALVLPPAKLHEFYYRMRVSWTVRFENVCSTLEATNFANIVSVGLSAHSQNYQYDDAKSKLEHVEDMVSADDVEITKIMES